MSTTPQKPQQATPPAQPAPTTPRATRARENPNATPQHLVAWLREKQEKGGVSRYELQLLSSTANPRVVDEYSARDGGGAPEQLADLLWARAMEDSHDSPDLASVYYGVAAFMEAGGTLLKRFTVPTPTRLDGRTPEPANQEGLLALGMRGLSKWNDSAHLFAVEMAKLMSDSTTETQLHWRAIVEAGQKERESLIGSLERQLAWKDAELARIQTRNETLETRALESRAKQEEYESGLHARQLEMVKTASGEERKDRVADKVIETVLPHFARRLGSMFQGAGPAPANAANGAAHAAAAPGPAGEGPFNFREQVAIHRFLGTLMMQPGHLDKIREVIKGTPAELAFDQLVAVLQEEALKKDEAEAAAAAAAQAPHTNGAAS
jgi:hypothetical protein